MGDALHLQLETTLSPQDLRDKLSRWTPWNALIEFSNGVTTGEFDRVSTFSNVPLYKLSRFKSYVPFEKLRGGAVLDVGCNAGYNAIHLATAYGLRPVGIDVQPRLIEVSRFLADVAGVGGEFLLEHADSFTRREAFDVVVHFGTLYHLQSPLRSLQSAYESLKPGGYLALETQVYDDPRDGRLCYFLHGLNADPSNFFALSTTTIGACLELLGFSAPREVFRHETPVGDRKHMFRVGLCARKVRGRDLAKTWPPWAG